MKIPAWLTPSRRMVVGTVFVLQACQGSGRAEPAPASAPAAVSVAPASSAQPARHVLLVVQHDSAGFHIRHAQVVEMALPSSRFPEAMPWRADVEDSAGKALASIALPAGGELRGEFARADGGMQAVHFRSEQFAFVLRVPLFENAKQIRFWENRAADASEQAAQASAKAAADLELGAAPYLTDVK